MDAPDAPDALVVPPDARRLHPLSPILAVIPALKSFALPAVLALASANPLLVGVLCAVTAIGLLSSFLRQRSTRYVLRDDELVVWSGILNRNVRVVSPMRVQRVEVVRLLRHRIADVAAVHVELVGSATEQTHVELDALALGEADRVRDSLERGRQQVRSGPEAPDGDEASTLFPPPPSPPLLRLPFRLLALGGVTGAPVLLVPVAVVSLLGEFGSVVEDAVDSSLDGLRLAFAAVAVLVVLGVGVWAVVAAGIMVVRFHGYELRRSGGDVVVRRGLLDTRTSVIPLHRVHLVHVSATVLRRALGLTSVDVRTASQGKSSGPASLATTVPVARSADAERLLPVLLDRPGVPLAAIAHPPSARRRAVRRRTVLLGPLGVVIGLALTVPSDLPGVGIVVGAAVAGGGGVVLGRLWGAAWYRRLGHGVGHGLVVATEGLLVTHQRFVPLARVQSVVVTQDPLQRRSGLVDLVANLAGPTPDLRIRDLSPDQAAAVARLVRGLAHVQVPSRA